MINIEELVANYMAARKQNTELKEAIRFYEELFDIALKQDDTKIVEISDRVILSKDLFNRLMSKQNHSFTVVKNGEYNTSDDNDDSDEYCRCTQDAAVKENSCHNCKGKYSRFKNQDVNLQAEDCSYIKELKRRLECENKTSYSKDSIIRFTSEDQR